MIKAIIEYSARNRAIVFILMAFLAIWGFWALKHIPLDAIPDLSDTQVIIFTEWTGRSPDLIEDQITFPITTTLLAAPKVEAVRGFSYLGSSFIYVIFEEGTDIYWARSRVLEYLQAVRSKIPAEVNPVLGPDATGVGWGFCYALVDETGQYNLAELRSSQDWYLKLALESVPGVSRGLCQAVPGDRRSQSTPILQHTDHESDRYNPEKQPGCGGKGDRVLRDRVYGERERVYQVPEGPGEYPSGHGWGRHSRLLKGRRHDQTRS
jgi:Cu/Ag efflux pump CusA